MQILTTTLGSVCKLKSGFLTFFFPNTLPNAGAAVTITTYRLEENNGAKGMYQGFVGEGEIMWKEFLKISNPLFDCWCFLIMSFSCLGGWGTRGEGSLWFS